MLSHSNHRQSARCTTAAVTSPDLHLIGRSLPYSCRRDRTIGTREMAEMHAVCTSGHTTTPARRQQTPNPSPVTSDGVGYRASAATAASVLPLWGRIYELVLDTIQAQ